MSSGLMWLAIHFCHFFFLVMLSRQCRWDKEMEIRWSAVTDQFFKKIERPLNATFLQNASIFIFIHSTLYLKMSIERFKASLESCPISISLTYGCFHWFVFVLNTVQAISCVFRGSSFALEIRTCHLLWLLAEALLSSCRVPQRSIFNTCICYFTYILCYLHRQCGFFNVILCIFWQHSPTECLHVS